MSTLLFLVVVALLLPAVFDLSAHGGGAAGVDERLSIGVSIVLLLLYGRTWFSPW